MRLLRHHPVSSCRIPLKVALLALFFFQSATTAQVKPTRRILILNETGTLYPSIDLIDQGIRTALGDSLYQVEFYREYFDTLLFPDPATQQEFRNFWKYQNRKPGVIVTVGSSPLRFMAEVHQEFFPGIPVIFWEAYKQYVIVGLLVFAVQALLILGLLWQRTRRKRMEAALKKTEAKFRMAFLRSPLAVSISRIEDSTYLDINETFERGTGWSRGEVIGRTPFDLGLWVDPEKRKDLQRRVMSGKNAQNVEFTFRTKEGRVKTGLGSAELIEIDGAQCMLSVATDITERKQLEERMRSALRDGEERFRFVANTAPVKIWMSDEDKRCVYFNQRWLNFTGRPLEAELGNGWAESVHPEDLDRCMDTYTEAFDRRQPFHVEYRLRRYDGEYRWVLDSGVPRFHSDGAFAGYIGSAVDVTDHKRAQEALSSLSGRLIEAQEQERHHLARELHDDINQKLAVLSFGLQQVTHVVPDSQTPTRAQIEPLVNQVKNISRDLRALSHRLHSSRLETLGLERAMQGFCRELAEQREVKVDFASSGLPDDPSQQVSLCLFRILQEGLNNAVKHSGVRHFEVELEKVADYLQLTIRDQGVGFDPGKAMHTGGIGLISMRERVHLLKGTLSIVSSPQAGTEIKARVPITAGAEAETKGALS